MGHNTCDQSFAQFTMSSQYRKHSGTLVGGGGDIEGAVGKHSEEPTLEQGGRKTTAGPQASSLQFLSIIEKSIVII